PFREAFVPVCKTCGISDDEVHLDRCPICHEMFCDEDKFLRSGRAFCSEPCAAGFFHNEDDEEGTAE
ncbi:MAG TPA: hypothetical protein VMQ62_02530, partial [Dongiaceae bacterium]|nr:hypothetical protein [Dongiaceae bacterium]